jgi:3-oxoacyl-[acyl-carrier protein] reductase
MLITFEGKRAIVAGAARGIGHAIAGRFAENGATVIACDRLVEEVEKFAGPVKSGTIKAAKVDVTDKASVEAVVRAAGGPIDVLVYVAGGIRGQRPKPLEQVPLEDFHQIVDANLTGAFLFAPGGRAGMKRAGKGRIVTISSRAALAPSLDRHPGLRLGQARPARAGAAARARARPVRHHGQYRGARVPAHQPGL